MQTHCFPFLFFSFLCFTLKPLIDISLTINRSISAEQETMSPTTGLFFIWKFCVSAIVPPGTTHGELFFMFSYTTNLIPGFTLFFTKNQGIILWI